MRLELCPVPEQKLMTYLFVKSILESFKSDNTKLSNSLSFLADNCASHPIFNGSIAFIDTIKHRKIIQKIFSIPHPFLNCATIKIFAQKTLLLSILKVFIQHTWLNATVILIFITRICSKITLNSVIKDLTYFNIRINTHRPDTKYL